MTDEQVLSYEQQVGEEIRAQADAEEIIVRDLPRVGQPIKHRIFRSATLGKQVVWVESYYELIDDSGQVIGYARQGSDRRVEDYGIPVSDDLKILKQRKRGT